MNLEQKPLLLSLLNGDPETMAANGFVNYHVEGVDYLCLLRNPQLTIKLYFLNEPHLREDGLLVAPHNHRYGFQQWCLDGTLEHIRFERDDFRAGWEEAEYTPEYRSWKAVGRTALHAYPYWMDRGETYSLDPTQIHTLAHVKSAVLLTFQYADERATSQTFFRDQNFPYIGKELYKKMDVETASRYIAQVRRLI